MSTTNWPRTDSEISFTGAYTCTHHSDQMRAACPVCLVTALTAERDQLRAVFPQICAALGNGAFCTPTVSVGFIESIPNEVELVIAELRARAERAEAEIERWRDSNNRLRAEMESQAQRAERAEAELATEREKVRGLREALADAADSGELTGCWFRQARAALAATEPSA